MAFKFRAAAALEIRRKQEDAARQVAAQAQTALAQAQRLAQDASAAVTDQRTRLVDAQAAGIESWRVQWHRAWIERQRFDAALRASEAEARAQEAATAQTTVQDAFRRRRVLERLRDRAARKHRRAADAQHVREMNDLATLRFVAQISEGEHRGD